MSKEQIISLEEAFEKGIVKVGDYVDYKPTYGEYRPKMVETGVDERQNSTFKTEDFGWKLDKFEGKLILVADIVTTRRLMLRGKVGYNNGVTVLNKITRHCYTDPALAAGGAINITKEIFKTLAPCNIMKNLREYWLGSCYVHSSTDYAHFGLYNVFSGKVDYDDLFRLDGYVHTYGRGVRPVVFLKSNIQLLLSEEGDGSKEKPWRPLREEPQPDFDTAKENKEEASTMSEENSFETNVSLEREKESLKDLLQQSEKIAVELMESLRQLNEMIQTIKEILNS